MRLGFTWNGLQLARALRTLPEAVSKKVVLEALTNAAQPVRALMQNMAPRAPGAPDIADHIAVSRATRIDGERRDESELAVAIGPERDFFYGYFLEWGTVKMAARPFARPAFDAGVNTSLQFLGGALWTAIKRRAASNAAAGTGNL